MISFQDTMTMGIHTMADMDTAMMVDMGTRMEVTVIRTEVTVIPMVVEGVAIQSSWRVFVTSPN